MGAVKLASGGISDPECWVREMIWVGALCKPFKLSQVGSAPLQRWSLEGPRELNGAPSGGSRETGNSWSIQCGQSKGDHPALRAVGVGWFCLGGDECLSWGHPGTVRRLGGDGVDKGIVEVGTCQAGVRTSEPPGKMYTKVVNTRLALLPGTPFHLVPSSEPSHHLQSHHLLHEPELSAISLCNLMLSPRPIDL